MKFSTLNLTKLEDLLVKEFRACQSLLAVTKDERLALLANNPSKVLTIVERKESVLDEMGQIDDQRRMVVGELASEMELSDPSPSIATLAQQLPEEFGGRLNRLRDGILALSGEIQELTRGNHTLATASLERNDELQSFLLDLFKPALVYQAPGTRPRVDSDLAWGVDQRT